MNISKQKAVTLLRFLYPIWALIGLFSLLYVPGKLIVAGNAALTASNIVSNELLFRFGIVGSLITQLIHIVVVLVLYKLFSSVDKNQSMLVVIFGLVGVPIAMLNTVNKVVALQFLNNPDQMMFFLNLNALGIVIASIFWGLWLFPQGILIYKSGFFPKVFGILMVIACLGFFLGSFFHLILNRTPPIFEIMTAGETIFMLWVIIRGAKLPKTNLN